MNKINEIPNNILYQFDSNRYVWKIELNSNGYGRRLFTEVYELNGKNMLDLVARGSLVDNPNITKDDEFSIFDYEKDDMLTFSITMPLTRASLDKVYLLRDAISRIDNVMKKR